MEIIDKYFKLIVVGLLILQLFVSVSALNMFDSITYTSNALHVIGTVDLDSR